jgi:hypothetical protein
MFLLYGLRLLLLWSRPLPVLFLLTGLGCDFYYFLSLFAFWQAASMGLG